jgi:hypothetical protein
MTETALANVGDDLFDPGGHKIGRITDVILDDRVVQPEWYVVRLGVLKGNHIVPAGSVGPSDIGLVVPYDRPWFSPLPGSWGWRRLSQSKRPFVLITAYESG